MKFWTLVLCGVLAGGQLRAHESVWQPSAGHAQLPIWPGAPPGAQLPEAPDIESTRPRDNLIAGKPWREVAHVSRPTMTVYSPKGRNSGAAVVVFPGGGYQTPAIDLEGTEACDWLTSTGVTCVLLKYRVPFSGPYWDERCRCHIHPKIPMALQDAQRTVGLLRHQAAQWHINPHKIGVLGFSAGGHWWQG